MKSLRQTPAIPIRLLRWACIAYATILVSFAALGAEPRVTVLAGVAHDTVSFETVISHPRGAQVFHERPVRYVAQTKESAEHAPPPEWIVKWLDGFLRSQGYVAVSDSAPYLLVFEWGPVDPQISHVGRPLQSVGVSGRSVIVPRETLARRYNERLNTTVPVCTISVYAQRFTGEPLTVDDLKWRTKIWLLLFKVPASGRVFAGPMTVLDYSFPPADESKSKAPSGKEGK